jgi:predicted peroxiredoxin
LIDYGGKRMKLGILVNTDKHLSDIIGLTKAALELGHDITVFTMDAGTRLFKHPEYSELCRLSGVKMSFCDHNAKMFDAQTGGIPEEIVCGSQFDNAAMMHECDKVIIL